MEKTKVIAISGHAQHGKDAFGRLLYRQLWRDGFSGLVVHYADYLKFICRTFLGWDGKKTEKGRTLLQHVGTDIIRKRNPDYWVDFIADNIEFFHDNWDYLIIPDTRFPNEITRLRERGIEVIHVRVVRPNYRSRLTEEQQKHPSETSLDNVKPDYYIYNDGSLDDLKKKIAKWAKENLYD